MEAGDVIKCGNISLALVIEHDGKLIKVWLPEFGTASLPDPRESAEVLFNLQDIFRDLATEEYSNESD